MKYETIK